MRCRIVNRPGYSGATDGKVPSPKKPSAKAKADVPKSRPQSQPLNSSTLPAESDSELSDLSSEHHTSPRKKPRPSTVVVDLSSKPKSAKGTTGSSKVKETANGKAHKPNGNGKVDTGESGPGKAKSKSKEGKLTNGESIIKGKEKAQPKPKPEAPVEPPLFEKVDTRLSLDEADQRMAVSFESTQLKLASRISEPVSTHSVHPREVAWRRR